MNDGNESPHPADGEHTRAAAFPFAFSQTQKMKTYKSGLRVIGDGRFGAVELGVATSANDQCLDMSWLILQEGLVFSKDSAALPASQRTWARSSRSGEGGELQGMLQFRHYLAIHFVTAFAKNQKTSSMI